MTFSPLPILTALGVRLVDQGGDRYRCACPVHRGDALSMAVALYEGRWQLTCFACGFSGGTVDLVAELRQCTIAEAFRELRGNPSCEVSPVPLYPRDVLTMACDAAGCGSTLDLKCGTYKVPGSHGYLWTSTVTDEAVFATSRGWEVGAHAEFALCPVCIG